MTNLEKIASELVLYFIDIITVLYLKSNACPVEEAQNHICE